MDQDPFKQIADMLNRMKPGQAIKISRDEINMLPGLPWWADGANITTGFDRVKESVFGANLPDVWRFYDEPDGSITAYRLPWKKGPAQK